MNQGCIVAQVTAQEEIMKIIPQVHQAVACSQKRKGLIIATTSTGEALVTRYKYIFYSRHQVIVK